jgi:hypothetical protein
MAWSVAARFGLDFHGWTLRRLEFWYRGHVELYDEEEADRQKQKAEIDRLRGKNVGRH